MYRRVVLFLALCALHVVPFYLHISESMAPLWAASIYLPLLGLKALGIPVFSTGISGGWQSPSWIGWTVVVLFWTSVWWSLAGFAFRLADLYERRAEKRKIG